MKQINSGLQDFRDLLFELHVRRLIKALCIPLELATTRLFPIAYEKSDLTKMTEMSPVVLHGTGRQDVLRKLKSKKYDKKLKNSMS